MKSFLNLTLLFFKSRLLSRAFWAAAAVLLILTAGFSLLCPQPSPSSAEVGLMYDASNAELDALCRQLLTLEEVRFIRYIEEEQLRSDVISGRLHCGYRINNDRKTPITVFETEASFLTPALDELVFSCWFEADMLKNAPQLYKNGQHAELINDTISRSRLENEPFSVNISVNAAASGGEYQHYSLLPIVYAVFIPLLLLCCCFCAMLSPDSERNAVNLISINGNSILLAQFFAHQLLFLLLSLICEAVMLALIPQNSFSVLARLLCAVILSFAGAGLFQLFGKIKANSAVLLLIIVWALLSIVFSGAFVSPELFGGLAILKYISPSWLLLRLMGAVTAL